MPPEMLTVISLAVLVTLSPGQDFALVMRSALCHSRSAAVMTALGISLSIWVHVAYCLAGIAFVIERSPSIFNILKYAGAGYLLYLGIQSIYKSFQKTNTSFGLESNINMTQKTSVITALRSGFLSNLLNPKTTLFFLGIFAQVVSPQTSFTTQLTYGGIISFSHLVWFVCVAYCFSSQKVTERFMHCSHKVDRVMGFVLCGLAVRLVL